MKLFRIAVAIIWLGTVASAIAAEGPEAIPVIMAVKSAPVSSVFYESEPVRFERKDASCGPVSYRVADWAGQTVHSGEWPDAGTAALEFKELPRGYYTLSLSGSGRKYGEPMSFAVVADAGKQPDPNRFFAVDTAQSWLSGAKKWNVRFPGEQYEAVSELCRRAGFGMVRDRFGWKHVEPEKGAFVPGKYGRNADLLAERGIPICTVFDMAPDWSRTHSSHFPDDLLALYRSAERIAERFRGRVAAWEFFNETDTGHQGPAWSFAAAAKAFALGLKAGNPDATLLNGSFSISPLQHYAHTSLKSGMGEYLDAFNYHVYSSLAEYPWVIARLRAEMGKYGLGRLPVWLTENGTRVDGNATRNGYRPGTMVHSPEQELRVAEFVPKSQLLMQSLGVARDFFFVMTPYWEQNGKKDWGLLHMDLSVKPAYVAFAAMNAELGSARLLGTLSPAENVAGYLYQQPDGRQTLVFWSKSDIDGKGFDGKQCRFTLRQPDGNCVLRNLFGTPSPVHVSGGKLELTATRYPAYLSGLTGLVAKKKPLPANPKPERRTERDLTVVLNPVLGGGFQTAKSGAYADLSAASGSVTLEIYNLAGEAKRGTISLTGGTAPGLPREVSVGPFSKKEIPLAVTAKIPEKGCQTNLVFSGLFNGKETTPAVVPLIQANAMRKEGVGRELAWRTPSRWHANSSGKMKIEFDEAEQALCFQTEFAPGTDRWVYPEYLLDLPSESLAGAVGITFEIKAGPGVRHGIAYTALMAVLEQGKAFWIQFPKVSNHWEKRVVILGGFDPAEVRKVRIGMNPKCDDFTWYIRNIRVVYGK